MCYSSCARGLPAAAEEWDVSALLIEGQPVQRETVVAYINAISQHVNNEVVIEEQHDSKPTRSMTALAQLLAFADAVGTSRGLLLALDWQVSASELVAEVQLGDELVQLRGDACHFYAGRSLLELSTVMTLEDSNIQMPKLADMKSAEDKVLLGEHVAAQTEVLLYLAYKLQLPVLQHVMAAFIKQQSCFPTSVLSPKLTRTIMSSRVVAAASAGSDSDVCNALANSSRMQACSFVMHTGKGMRQLLKPLDLTPELRQPITFKAEVQEDFLCYRKGQEVTARLDLFGTSELVIQQNGRNMPHNVQLLLGA